MTLRRRLLLLLLATAPLLWLVMLVLTLLVTRKEVDELFDTRQVKMAQQLLVLLPDDPAALPTRAAPLPAPATDLGAADLEDMAVSVAAANGSLLLADREGQRLPRDAPPGFQTTDIGGEEWRIYTLVSSDGRWRITVGQLTEERAELTWDVMASQSMTMLLGLALLVGGMTWAVRSALRPVERMRHALLARPADDLRPVYTVDVPADLQPLVQSINTLLTRVGALLAHERQLIADAAHELRTPLAALRAQWEAAQAADANAGSGDRTATREHAVRQVGLGIERLTRLVNQLLALARVEGESGAQAARGGPVDWQRVVQDALSDCLPLIDATGAEIDVRWPPEGTAPLPLDGNEALLSTLLRNLIDNALRYGGEGTQVRIEIGADALVIDDSGPGAPAEVLARMGDRFYRGAPAAATSGSGLGLSIVKRIARLHGLDVSLQSPPPGQARGLRVSLRRVVS